MFFTEIFGVFGRGPPAVTWSQRARWGNAHVFTIAQVVEAGYAWTINLHGEVRHNTTWETPLCVTGRDLVLFWSSEIRFLWKVLEYMVSVWTK